MTTGRSVQSAADGVQHRERARVRRRRGRAPRWPRPGPTRSRLRRSPRGTPARASRGARAARRRDPPATSTAGEARAGACGRPPATSAPSARGRRAGRRRTCRPRRTARRARARPARPPRAWLAAPTRRTRTPPAVRSSPAAGGGASRVRAREAQHAVLDDRAHPAADVERPASRRRRPSASSSRDARTHSGHGRRRPRPRRGGSRRAARAPRGSAPRCASAIRERPASATSTTSSRTADSARRISIVRGDVLGGRGMHRRERGQHLVADAPAREAAALVGAVLAPRQAPRDAVRGGLLARHSQQRAHEPPLARRDPAQRAPPGRGGEAVEHRLDLVRGRVAGRDQRAAGERGRARVAQVASPGLEVSAVRRRRRTLDRARHAAGARTARGRARASPSDSSPRSP